MTTVFDRRACTLGEGPLWHPERHQLFWFDILGRKLMSRAGGKPLEWQFDEYVSAAGWVDQDTLLMASENGLYRFDIATGARELVVALEADNSVTRSNDGRADPQGGFWIGTMGINLEPGAGAIYRYCRGELRKLYGDISISNAICFAPSGDTAYFCDTPTRQIMSQKLDANGWPLGQPTVFVDLNEADVNPDGAVVDESGNLWNAQWGAHRVACYGTDGTLKQTVSFAAEQISCPAFGGADLKTLFATSAADGLDGEAEGRTYSYTFIDVTGQAEHRVIL